jgi:hypothetical protein
MFQVFHREVFPESNLRFFVKEALLSCSADAILVKTAQNAPEVIHSQRFRFGTWRNGYDDKALFERRMPPEGNG